MFHILLWAIKVLFVITQEYLPAVEPITASKPSVSSLSKIVNVLLTKTLPSSKVQSRKFPFLRIGYIMDANFCSDLVPDFMMICSSIGSSDIKPKFKPENNPDSARRIQIKIICKIRFWFIALPAEQYCFVYSVILNQNQIL